MEELYESLSEQEKEKYCFFLDNLSFHSTAELFTLYKKNINENYI